MAKAKAEKQELVITPDEALDAVLKGLKLDNMVRLAADCQGMEVESFSTGFPQLDMLINPSNPGFPRQRHIHIYSKVGSVGKSTLVAQIVGAAQRQAMMRVGLADAENTMTESFLQERGVVTVKDAVPGVTALRWIREKVRGTIPVEVYFQVMSALADVLDLIVVDSVAALDKKANIEKQAAGGNAEMCGVAKNLSEFLRNHLARNAGFIWINQTRDNVGGFSPAPGGPPPKPTGGKALNFYSSLNLELDRLESVKGAGDEVVGFKTKVTVRKNKVGYADRSTTLTHIYGLGFSAEYDYLQMAINLGAVLKNKGWLAFEDTKIQGELKFATEMRNNPELRAAIVKAVDGEEVPIEEEEPVFDEEAA